MEKITSKENKAIKEYGKLASSKTYRDKTGLFVIESVKLVKEAFLSGVKLQKVFVTQDCFEKKDDSVLQKLFMNTRQLFEITPALEQKLSQTGNAQGIFAICEKLDKQQNLDTMKKGGKYLYLSCLQDTGNVGTIIRTGEAMGIDGIIISRNTCDRYSLKVLRASMGSAFRVPIYHSENTLEDLYYLKDHFTTYAAVLDDEAVPVGSFAFSANSVVLIGNEGNGLEPEVADACNYKITIRMSGKAESLNASMAAGILLWEMNK